MKLRINPLVISDLKEIRESVSEDSSKRAEKTVEEIYGTFENIQEFPYIGASLSKWVSFKTDYRYSVISVHKSHVTHRCRTARGRGGATRHDTRRAIQEKTLQLMF